MFIILVYYLITNTQVYYHILNDMQFDNLKKD